MGGRAGAGISHSAIRSGSSSGWAVGGGTQARPAGILRVSGANPFYSSRCPRPDGRSAGSRFVLPRYYAAVASANRERVPVAIQRDATRTDSIATRARAADRNGRRLYRGAARLLVCPFRPGTNPQWALAGLKRNADKPNRRPNEDDGKGWSLKKEQ